MMNMNQLGKCDCGIAITATACRLAGLAHLKVIDIYTMFIYENGTCIIDMAIFLS
jgi:hypothetical protein